MYSTHSCLGISSACTPNLTDAAALSCLYARGHGWVLVPAVWVGAGGHGMPAVTWPSRIGMREGVGGCRWVWSASGVGGCRCAWDATGEAALSRWDAGRCGWVWVGVGRRPSRVSMREGVGGCWWAWGASGDVALLRWDARGCGWVLVGMGRRR